MSILKRPNSIEKKNGMNCDSCDYSSRCRYAAELKLHERENHICANYSNERKGVFGSAQKLMKVL